MNVLSVHTAKNFGIGDGLRGDIILVRKTFEEECQGEFCVIRINVSLASTIFYGTLYVIWR